MYDALLDEFEDETTTRTRANATFDDAVVGDVEDEDPVDLLENNTNDTELQAESEDLFAGMDDTESWSDDPVRMYLTQMGEIPLLTRQQEISLAKQIEDTRRRFRTKLLECDYVIQEAYKTLKRVFDGELPFDRTVQVSVTDRLEKEQILGRIPHNLKTLEVLLKRNRIDYHIAVDRTRPKAKRIEAWRRLSRRRRRAVRLVEELGLRTQRLETKIRHLEDFSREIDFLQEQIRQSKADRANPADITRLISFAIETSRSLKRR